MKDGIWKVYADNGKFEQTFYTLNKKNGIYYLYGANKKLLTKGNYKNDKQNGLWTYYFENGKLRSDGNYVNGVQEGIWVEYTETGVGFEFTMSNGKMIKKVKK